MMMARLVEAIILACWCAGYTRAQSNYSTNAICRQQYCVNPIFPAMQDLSLMETNEYQCQPSIVAGRYMQFCKNAVNYDVALISSNAGLEQAVGQQESAAVTAYFYHLAAMNIEAHRYKVPEESRDECIQSVWRMVCATHFPRAQAGCQAGNSTSYVRPCRNVCEKYVLACNVRCCDESVQCAATQSVSFAQGAAAVNITYANELGPSLTCTGSAPRIARGLSPAVVLAGLLALVFNSFGAEGTAAHRHRPTQKTHQQYWTGPAFLSKMALIPVVMLSALTLQGCLPIGHPASAWETKPSYMMTYAYLPFMEKHPVDVWTPPAETAVLNSCETRGLAASKMCSGHGVCRQWNMTAVPSATPISFCACDRQWADPECRTRRKSQATAFFLSLFFGYLGIDKFYLQEIISGTIKLATLGGVGVWWIIDIVRIGSSPIYAGSGFRLSADLPHWLYVGSSVSVFMLLGVVLFTYGAAEVKKRQTTSKMLKQAEDAFHKTRSATVNIRPVDRIGMPTIATYSMPYPPYGTMRNEVPAEVRIASYGNKLSTHNHYVETLKQAELTGDAERQAARPAGP